MGQRMLANPQCHGAGCCHADCSLCVTLPPGNKLQVKHLDSSACLGYNRALERNEREVEFLKPS